MQTACIQQAYNARQQAQAASLGSKGLAAGVAPDQDNYVSQGPKRAGQWVLTARERSAAELYKTDLIYGAGGGGQKIKSEMCPTRNGLLTFFSHKLHLPEQLSRPPACI
jgi:hypothetical protein